MKLDVKEISTRSMQGSINIASEYYTPTQIDELLTPWLLTPAPQIIYNPLDQSFCSYSTIE
uniref:Uncharacterized protein n=1 Tax=Spironucleus salmonicida TaxID=348837 RepID=V6LVE6_9EUKA|eukprot:EST48622.1 Hypothetical protein SS50377_11234 [Spironucleus salmonicida]